MLGDGDLAEMIRRKLELFPDMHLSLVDEHDVEAFDALAGGVDRVIFASDLMEPGEVGGLVALCRERQVKLSVISPLHGRAGPVRLSRVADLPVLEYETWDPSRSTAMIKRGFDIVVSSVGLLLTAPLFPVIAIAIRLDSRGPIFFNQTRAGLDGRPFEMHKFRTMVADAEERLTDVVRLDDLRDPVFKLSDDPRVTRVGRFLRRLSLDELPQLWNVLRGEMSIVGPRPEQVELVRRYRPEHRFRLSVKPGITGPMQVFGRGDLTFHERLAVELDYIENLSLARDLRIIAETVPVTLRGSGAYWFDIATGGPAMDRRSCPACGRLALAYWREATASDPQLAGRSRFVLERCAACGSAVDGRRRRRPLGDVRGRHLRARGRARAPAAGAAARARRARPDALHPRAGARARGARGGRRRRQAVRLMRASGLDAHGIDPSPAACAAARANGVEVNSSGRRRGARAGWRGRGRPLARARAFR